jgi:hypothetical protein
VLEKNVVFNVDTIAAYLPLFIQFSFRYSEGYAKGRTITREEQFEVFLEELKQSYIKSILEQWIENLALTFFWNQDIAPSVYQEYAIWEYYWKQKIKVPPISEE